MLCIYNTCTDAWFNLAAEEYLLKNFSEDIFMLCQNEPAVVIGKHQNIWAETDLDYIQEKQIKVARRFSGGGAVYHDMGNLNLTFIENSSQIDAIRFTENIIRFLGSVGIHAKADERQGLTIDGLKISGSAQAIHKRRMMHHATLLFTTNLNTLNRVLQPTASLSDQGDRPPSYFVKSVKSPVTNLSGLLPPSTSIDDFKSSLVNYFFSRNEHNSYYEFKTDDLREIWLLRNGKYADKNWIYNTCSL